MRIVPPSPIIPAQHAHGEGFKLLPPVYGCLWPVARPSVGSASGRAPICGGLEAYQRPSLCPGLRSRAVPDWHGLTIGLTTITDRAPTMTPWCSRSNLRDDPV